MKDVKPLEYISTLWIPEPSDVDLLLIANVAVAFYSIGAITDHQAAVINGVISDYMDTEIFPDFDEVMEVIKNG